MAVCQESRSATLCGVLAIVLWSTCVPIARSIVEQTGPMRGGGTVQLIGGVLATLYFLRKGGLVTRARELPRRYFLGCGGLFVLYFFFLYLAIGIAANRLQFIGVGLIQYLWPTLTIIFSLMLTARRASRYLPIGILLATVGVYHTVTSGEALSLKAATDNSAPFILALLAAVSWALYSTLTARWASASSGGFVGFFMMLTGVVLLCLSVYFQEVSSWPVQTLLEIGYLCTVSTAGYVLWDLAMRRGNVTTVSSFSYLTPFLYSLFGCYYLGTTPSVYLWIGCAFIVAGAVICRASVFEKQ